MGVPTRILLYHITHINNLASVVGSGGLQCYNTLKQNESRYTNIAYQHIQDRRSSKAVPCGPCGTLHDYVPFYFAPRSPMLYAINQGNVPRYAEGQKPVIHLVTSLEKVITERVPFVFTDGHGTVELTDFFEDTKQLDKIDWEVMKSEFWADTDDDPDRKRRRQAELLIYNFVPWQLIIGVGVLSQEIKTTVEEILEVSEYKPTVKVLPRWYY